MKKSELDGLRNILRIRQAELNDGRRNHEALAIETNPEGDRIQHAQERDFAMEALNRESVRWREDRAALESIESGGFGICLNSEEDIRAKRRAAVPWTALCIVCEEAADHMGCDSQEQDTQALLNVA